LDRLARQQYDHHSIKALLQGYGVKLMSVTEPLTDDPSGRLMEGILSAFAQFDNEVRGERARLGMIQQARDGYWCWQSPLGYESARTKDGRPTMTPNPETAPLVRRTFEMVAGGHSQKDIIQELTAEGFCGKYGGEMTPQSLHQILRNPAYAGLLSSSLVGPEPIKGQWEPLVSLEIFVTVQRSLTRQPAWIREDKREEFPLRHWIRCDFCKTALTASWSTGRGGKRYAHYRCYRCGKAKARKERLEEAFQWLLGRVRFSSKELVTFRAVIKDVWEEHGKRVSEECRRRYRQRERLQKKKERMIDLLVDSAISKNEYDRRMEKLGLELQLAESDENGMNGQRIEIESALESACQLLENPTKAWLEAQYITKQQIQVLIFPEAPTWNGETFGTVVINKAIEYLRPDGPAKSSLAPRVLANWNQTIKFLLGIQRLGKAS
jgi:hypothetical protein